MNARPRSAYYSPPSSYGAAGTLPMSDDEKAAAEKRKRPVGFAPASSRSGAGRKRPAKS